MSGRESLTLAERRVFDLAAIAIPNAEIARRLGISVKTVQTHRAKVNAKLGVHSAAELVLYAHRAGAPTASSGPP